MSYIEARERTMPLIETILTSTRRRRFPLFITTNTMKVAGDWLLARFQSLERRDSFKPRKSPTPYTQSFSSLLYDLE